MTALAEAVDITVHEHQLRITAADAESAFDLVRGASAAAARTRLRFGPGRTYEQLARVLDRALVRAGERGLAADALVVSAASAVPAEDIVRIRRKAHGIADWISSPSSDVTVVLQPLGLAAVAAARPPADRSVAPEQPREHAPETEAELAIREALYDVIDPDLGVNVVDLGFVRQVRIGEDGVATLTMTLTSAACPLTEVMERNVAAVLAGTAFVIDWEWLPSWRPQDISEDGREQLRAIGFSAF